MMTKPYDVIVIGSGPAGCHAALHAAAHGAHVALVEKERKVGGACVYRGTIPSKTLRETAVRLGQIRRSEFGARLAIDEQTEISSLMSCLDQVIEAHVGQLNRQLEQNGITRVHGRASFVSKNEVRIERVRGESCSLTATYFVTAVGSRPRKPPRIPIDHENVLDSDSILSMIYLPRTLTVLGGGVIACEWASIFAELGVTVTIIDRNDRPLPFMDEDLTKAFTRSLEKAGSRYLAHRHLAAIEWDGVSEVVTTLEDGEQIRGRKLLCALGRVANLDGLNLEAAGITPTAQGLIEVNEHGQTCVSNIYAAGDVIGYPALAATSMQQGRRAVAHALGLGPGPPSEHVPVGIFTIPEMASVGLTEAQAIEKNGGAQVGTARLDQVARGQIAGVDEGTLKLVADADGQQLLGAHIVGAGATELIHIAQLALVARMPVEGFISNIFNFPTLAEAYRVAAIGIVRK